MRHFKQLYKSILPQNNLFKRNLKPQSQSKAVRTRFAPSPTGFLHIGSLRTALFNYLAAKANNGQFLLRLEDTDQKRLVPGAEQDIYETLKKCGLEADESPVSKCQDYGPYRQSDRTEIYNKYASQLLEKGHAYRCFCSKERLTALANSAKQLVPPTNVSYDRHCHHLSEEEISQNIADGKKFTVRLKSPDVYPEFTDLLHGTINIQPQVNLIDKRYDDPVLLKSDNLPTYHFANVVDDHLMKITHVIRGEEWLFSTPKHIALYSAFGWQPPKFVHIPLLTNLQNDKKLSKRMNDTDVSSFLAKGILPEALINFCVLFGWTGRRELSLENEAESQLFDLKYLEKHFSLDNLTRGNTKVDFSKLYHFNKIYLAQRISNAEQRKELAKETSVLLTEKYGYSISESKVYELLPLLKMKLVTKKDICSSEFSYFFEAMSLDNDEAQAWLKANDLQSVTNLLKKLTECEQITAENLNSIIKTIGCKKPEFFQTLRFALCGSVSGVNLKDLLRFLGPEECQSRIQLAIKYCEHIN